MIPVRLSMRNFMCYRDNVPPLYFDGIHTACISGNNGNGKSALIDAITWALWGESRAKSDDDLIHQGQTEMGVEFDFAVREQLYRIIRKHTKPKRRRASGQTILELQVATESVFRSITGNGILETQKKIKDILHMDYPTFINSAFLRQGRADEFTKQPPAKRKEVLANILGLAIYDELEEQAKDLAKQRETEKAQLESTIEDISAELVQKPILETKLNQVQSELEQIEAVIREQESRLSRLRQKRESLESKKLQLLQLEEHISETEKDIERWDELARQHLLRIKEYEALIAQRSAIEEGYAQLAQAKKLSDEFDQKLRQTAALNERRHQLEMAIERAQAALITEHKLAQSKIEELEAKSQRLPQLKIELRQVESQLTQLSGQEEVLRQRRQACQKLQAQVNYLESNRAHLEQEIIEIEEKLKMLLTQREAKCPLCETELGVEGLKLITTKYATDRDGKSKALKSNQVELANKKTEVRLLESEISRLEDSLNQSRGSIQSRVGLLSREITEAEMAGSQLNEERVKLAEIEQRLARKDFATLEQRALTEIEAGVAKLAYDPQHHDEIRQQLVSLQQFEKPKQKLEEADRLIEQERQAASKAEETARQRRHSLEVANQKRQELISELSALPQLANDLAQAEAKYQAMVTQQRQAQEILGSVKAMLQRCSELEVKKREKEKSLRQASTEGTIYRELAQAFGKRGIQAWLIETTLPEIETEANKLLARMTDNRMHVKIETQRETKKGDLLETLDINISDELGTRDYEMFSGGEAFRINFAIRIALSKLLARRAGAPLRTLIIDEGFGTQDSTGIEKIKEAINSIQDDFDKILVITHIEALRDAFPTRIEVVKTGDGSTLEIS